MRCSAIPTAQVGDECGEVPGNDTYRHVRSWTQTNCQRMADAGFSVIRDFPAQSPDLNVIENAWMMATRVP